MQINDEDMIDEC